MSAETSKTGTPAAVAVRSPYLPQIDGLRTLAILGVMLFHLKLPGTMLGWSGVWLFYVISGFLITGILLDSKSHPGFFKNFYARRALRIFPVYFLGLFGLLGVALAGGWAVRDFGYYLCYLQNHLLGTTQFKPAFPAAYNHTWTLAVEEQFYLFWPLLVWFLTARRLAVTCVAMLVLAPLARGWLLHWTHNPFMAFTPLVTDLDAFAAGGLVAISLRHQRVTTWLATHASQAKRGGLMIGGLLSAAILGIVLHYRPHAYWSPIDWLAKVDANIFLTSLLSLWFAGLIFYVVVWDGWPRRWLSGKWIVHVGKISYGIYIFHGLVLTYAGVILGCLSPRLEQNRIAVILINLVLPYLLARLSWRFVESPFLRLKKNFMAAK